MTIAIIYITLGVLYTIACIMDGQDVKPLWKRWLGCKLESYADRLKPIDYCNRDKCKYYQKVLSFQSQPVFRTVEIEQRICIGESELMRARRDEAYARRYRMPLPRRSTVDGLVEDAKEQIACSILRSAKSYINIEMREDKCYNEIYLCGSLYVVTKQIF